MTGADETQTGKHVRHLRDWMRRPGYEALFDALGPEQARFVGGCVRDSLLGRDFDDVDVACQHAPEQTLARLERAKIRCLPTGLKHGTVTALLPASDDPDGWHRVEITSLREDLRTDGRHAEVGFTQDWACDAARRDLTMNALYLGFDGQIYDPLGTGLEDARQGLVRFVGDPRQRIEEDFLRLLRYFRFAASYAKRPLDCATLAVCQALAPGLARLSGERVQAELFKLLALPSCGPLLEIMEARAIMQAIWPGPRSLERLQACVARFAALERAQDPLVLLRAWLAVKAPDLAEVARRLRLSNADAQRLKQPLAALDQSDAVLLFTAGRQAALDSLLLAEPDDWSLERFRQLERAPLPVLPLQGRDLLEAGVAPGPDLGQLLNATQDWWIKGDCRADAGSCLLWAMVHHERG